jgi:hypothetical protein
MFVGILALTAFVIAGVAAYFSVQGIATLYAGAYISVLVMAGALEVGKLVATEEIITTLGRVKRLFKGKAKYRN